MSSILDKLHDDHKNFIKLLAFLEKQLKLLEACERIDLQAIHDAVRYMKEYPDQVHHPLEDVVFRYYIKHYDEGQNNINELLNEHEEMPSLTNKLNTMLQDALLDVPQERKELCGYLQKYIAIQKEHMNLEESQIYPILKANLSKNDWNQISNQLTIVNDPLFGKRVVKSFEGLLQQIPS